MSKNKQIVFGLHSVELLVKKHPERILYLCVLQQRHDKKIEAILQVARRSNIQIEAKTKADLESLVAGANHQGIVAVCQSSSQAKEEDLHELLANLTEPAFLLILDGVQDPHNLGACFRSADAAGVHAIIAPKDKSVGITPIVSKVACGAVETMPFFQVTNLARTIEELKEQGIWIYGAAAEAEKSLYQTDFKGPIAIVLGSEGNGLRRLTRDLCDGLANIPMRGAVSSLNVSVATGIFLFEALRQRATNSR